MELIPPHGGKLVERLVLGAERDRLIHQAQNMPSVTLDEWELSDIELLAVGALSPLEGFLNEADYDAVLDRMRLVNGTLWPLPVTLSLAQWEADLWREGQEMALRDPSGELVAVLHQPELYPYNRGVEAKLLFGTADSAHPGMKRLLAQGPYHVGGRVSVVNLPGHPDFIPYRLTPAQARQEFRRRGWSRVVGFQTRSPIHRAHEYLLRCALEMADGLMVQPLMGPGVADGEVPAQARMRCCEVLVDSYLPRERTVLAVNPAGTRHAGPKEEVFHAIVRQNYGCSHFIIGQDRVATGKSHGPADAQGIFGRFTREDLGVTPLCFDIAFYCRSCEGMATAKTCTHPLSQRVSLNSSALQQMLSDGKPPPPEFTRPEIAEILKEAYVSQT
ncbi:MAG: sulfate adenylyltransferase [Candidatus Omnitrophota bacterium]|nr:sulfate adenylyltransferase [Candidatus Omnitrophota bacterium]